MYLFAQRVRSPRGAEGINAGLYRHQAAASLPFDTWRRPPEELHALITTASPGERVRDRVSVAPGGNRVESWLDIIGPDGTDEAHATAAVQQIRQRLLAGARRPILERAGDVTGGFGANGEDAGALAHDLEALFAFALPLLATPEAVGHVGPPLNVIVNHDATGFRFSLDNPSAERVLALGGRPESVSIRHEVAADFVEARLYAHLPELLTGLPAETVLTLGGARFIGEQEEVLAVWPARA